jgi:hypothetical protein
VVLLPGTALELPDQRLGAAGEPLQARLDVRLVGERVQPLGARLELPGVCAPRSSSTVTSARSSSARPSASASVWWYLSVRRPVSAQTMRSSPRSRRARAVVSIARSSRSITGSRLEVWLHAVRSALSVSG